MFHFRQQSVREKLVRGIVGINRGELPYERIVGFRTETKDDPSAARNALVATSIEHALTVS